MTHINIRNAVIALRRLLSEDGPDGDEQLIWWLFDMPGVESALGEPHYSELAQTNFVDPAGMQAFRDRLRVWVDEQQPTACLCFLLGDEKNVADYFSGHLYRSKWDRIACKTPLVNLWRCRLCAKHWFEIAVVNNDGDWGAERAWAGQVADVMQEGTWPSFEWWESGEDAGFALMLSDAGPGLNHWLRDAGCKDLEDWRAPIGSELHARHRAELASLNNRDDIAGSSRCLCWACWARFAPEEVRSWMDDIEVREPNEDCSSYHGLTAKCPRCREPAVLGDASPFSPDEAIHQHVEWSGWRPTDITAWQLWHASPQLWDRFPRPPED